ncbi:hypothetical protein DSO57_1033603 [Entomophthora muscae]|uniref:Uncharacterized protein n=1 Tax=Entomophthora muscae TaxID=34485 RepID=A0ACC2U931_9FUNG|nr:hypothetical protein DSO57_1033603 [Entomophthora muscae]
MLCFIAGTDPLPLTVGVVTSSLISDNHWDLSSQHPAQISVWPAAGFPLASTTGKLELASLAPSVIRIWKASGAGQPSLCWPSKLLQLLDSLLSKGDIGSVGGGAQTEKTAPVQTFWAPMGGLPNLAQGALSSTCLGACFNRNRIYGAVSTELELLL